MFRINLPKSFGFVQFGTLLVLVYGLLNVSHAASMDDLTSPAFQRTMTRLYDECQRADDGFSICIKAKAITFLDRFAQIDSINLADGVKVVRNSINSTSAMDGSDQKDAEKDDWEKTLPRGLEARDDAMTDLLVRKAAKVLSDRTIKVEIPRFSAVDVGRGLEEGRGKMKKMMSMMMMGVAMKMVAMVPAAIAMLYMLAGKALIISKIALLLAGIMAVKKLIASKQSGGGGGASSGWSSGGGGGGGGWQSGGGGYDRRSASEAAHPIAYKAYATSINHTLKLMMRELHLRNRISKNK